MKTKITAPLHPLKVLTAGFYARFNGRLRRLATARLAGLACVLVSWPAAAAIINWGTPMSITGDTDVSANGSALYAYSGGIASGTLTLNGVTFSAGSGFATWGNVSFASGFTGSSATNFTVNSAPFNSLSQTYSNLLVGGAYGGATTGTVTLNGLTPNEAYAVQIWVSDPRSAGVGRYETASNTVASASTALLLYNNANSLGSPGQYVIGTFLANGTSQSFTLIPSGGGSVQLNAISVRDLGGINKIWLGATDTSWGASGNWSPNGAPLAGQSVVFNNLSTANLATLPDQSYTLTSIVLSNAPSPVSIGSSGNSLTINGGINLFGSGQSLTINDPIVLGGFQTWTNNGNLTLNADISGSAGLTITGNGVMTISQPVTYLYKTTISGGTLALSGSGSLASSSISIAGGATLNVSAEASTFTLGGRTLGNSSSGAVINGANDCTSGILNLVFDGTNPCFIQTNGVMTLSSSTVITVNYSGAVLPAGTNTLIAAATTGSIGQVTVSDSLPPVVLLGNGAVGQASLAIDGSGNLNLVITTPDVWTGAANNLWSNGGNWIPGNEPLSGDSILFNNFSTANLNVSQDDTGSGGVVNGLTLLNPVGPVTISGPGNLSVSSGGLNLSAASQNLTIAAPLIVNANQNWLVTNSRLLTISGPVSSVSGGNVTISGGGTVKLGAPHILDALTNNLSTCDLTVNSSKLDLNGNSQVMNGLNGSTNTVIDNTAASPVTLTIGGNGNSSTNSGVIQNSGGGALQLQVAGGDVQLLGTNTYSGGTLFNGGRLYFPSASALSTGPVTFNSGSGAYTSGRTFTNALTLNGAYLRVGGANNNVQTWSGPIAVINGFQMSGDSGTWGVTLSGPINIGTGGITITNSGDNGPQMGFNVSTTGDLLSGAISGSGGITYYLIGGNSRLTVQGTNTYSGGTIVNGIPDGFGNGKLNVYGGNYGFSTGPVTLNAGAIIESAPGNATITNALTLNGGTLQSEPQYNNYNTLTWSGPVTLTADSALVQNATGALNSNQSSGVNLAGALNMNGFTLTCSSPVACYGGNTISGSISGTGNILENGINPQALTVSGSNTFSGTFRSVSGTLSVKNLYALQNATLDMNAADAGAVSISTNAIIGALTGSRDLNLGSYTISIGNNNASTTFSGGLTNSGSLIKVGSGTLTLSGATSFAGNTTVNGGTLSLSQSPFGTNSTVKVAGGAILDLNYNGTNTIAGLVLNGVSKPTGIYNAANSGGLITGAGALQVTPPNAWIGNVSTSWNQTGNWAINVIPGNGSNAVFNFYSTANLATVLNANFNLNTLLIANPSGPVSIAAGGAYVLTLTNGIDMSSATQPLTITAPVVIGASQTWPVAANMTLSVNGPVSGADLTVSGGGTIALGGTNNYGATTISSGTTLQISGAGQLGSGNYASNIVNSGILKYSSSANQTLSGTISGNGAIIKDTSSTSTLTIGAPTASGRNNGATTVSAGTLAVNSAGSLYSTSTYQANSTVTVNSGATLSLYAWGYGYVGGIGALDLAAARLKVNGGTIVYTGVGEGFGVNNQGRLFTIGTGGATLAAEGTGTWFLEAASSGYDGANGQVIPSGLTLTLAGTKNGRYDKLLSGAGSLIKSGAGIWTLTSTNAYTGGTAINGGNLFVNNTLGSGTGTGAVNINNGGTLGGTGTISGLVTNNAGGTLYPGAVNGIGKLTLNGNATLLAGSTSTFLVNGSTAVASNSVAVGAAITYGGVLNIATNGSFAAGQKFTLFSGTGATNTSNFASITGSPGAGLAFTFTNGVLSVVSSVLPNPVISSVTVSGGNLILQGNNGAPFGTYSVLTSTNVALPLSSWTTNSTGTFTASGSFSNAIPVTSQPQQFFDIKQP